MPSIIKKSQTKNEKLCFFQMRYLWVCDTLGFAKEDAKPLTPFLGLKDGLQYSITTASVWHGKWQCRKEAVQPCMHSRTPLFSCIK